jgi:hypothetical protein
LDLGHLYFDIVSDLELRISDFASLGIFTLVKNPLQIGSFYAKQTQFPKKSNERKRCYNKGLQKKDDFAVQKNKPNSNPIQSQLKPKNTKTNPIQTQSNPISRQT